MMLTCSLLNLTFLQIPLMWVSFLLSLFISQVMLGMVVSMMTNPHFGQQVSCLILSLVTGCVLQQGQVVFIVVQLLCDILPYFHIIVLRFRVLVLFVRFRFVLFRLLGLGRGWVLGLLSWCLFVFGLFVCGVGGSIGSFLFVLCRSLLFLHILVCSIFVGCVFS